MGADAEPLPEPAQRLPPAALSYWRASGLIAGVIALAAALGVAAVVPGALRWPAVAAGLTALVVFVAVAPGLRFRRWRYEVRDDEIDIRHGTFVVRRTLVPIRRVQHVETEAGPLMGSFGLASVSFHTAAGATEIPALEVAEAERVRARIGRLARTLDDV